MKMISKYAKKQFRKQKNCNGKVQYKNRKKAWDLSFWYFTHLGTFATPYKCKYCYLFHLTKKHVDPSVPPEYIKKLAKWFGMEVQQFEKIIE